MKRYIAIFLATALAQGGCTSTARKDRDPAATQIPTDKKEIKLIQIVRIENSHRALYMVEDTAQKKFSVAECVAGAPGEDTILSGTVCTLLSDTWLPSGSDTRAAFDQAFNAQIEIENTKLHNTWSFKGTLANFAIGSAVAIGSGVALLYLRNMTREGWAIPGSFVVVPAAVVGIGIMVAAEIYDSKQRSKRTIERDLLRLSPRDDRRIIDQAAMEVYMSLRTALALALVTGPTL